MIIPIGHEQTTVRRLPWVTFTIMAICVVVFLYTNAARGGDPNDRLQEVGDYFLEHPYLELPQDVENVLWGRGDATQDEADAATEALRSARGTVPGPRQRELEQQHLDELVERLYGSVVPKPLREHGLVPAHFEVSDLLTHMFLHGGWMHLIGNLFFLYLAGPFIEDVWGRPLFLGFYLVGGVVAGGLYALKYPEFDGPLIGASGAIAAVMGAFLIRYFAVNIRFFYWFGLIIRGTFSAPAWLMLPLWFARELVFAHGLDVVGPESGGSGVAYWAHVWGFGFGVVVALALRQAKVEERYLDAAIERKVTLVDNAAVASAMELRDAGRHDEALALLRPEVQRDPGNPDLVHAYWTVAAGAGAAVEAAPYVMRVVREHLRTPGEEELAVASWWDLRREAPEVAPDLQVALRIAEWLRGEERVADAREVVRDAVEQVGADAPGGLLVRLARVAESVGAPEAARAADLAVRHPETPPEVRAELARLAADAPPAPASDASPSPAPVPSPVAPSAPPPAAAAPVSAGAEPGAWAPPAGATWAAEDGDGEEPADGDGEEPAEEPGPIDLATPPAERTLRVMEAVPVRLEPGQLVLAAEGQQRALGLSQVAAVSVAGVRRADGAPYLLVDVLLDGPWSDAAELRVLRLSSTGFNPLSLMPGAGNPMDGFRALVAELLHASGGVPLPDPDAAAGNPFRVFASLDEYEHEVLGAPESEGPPIVAH